MPAVGQVVVVVAYILRGLAWGAWGGQPELEEDSVRIMVTGTDSLAGSLVALWDPPCPRLCALGQLLAVLLLTPLYNETPPSESCMSMT